MEVRHYFRIQRRIFTDKIRNTVGYPSTHEEDYVAAFAEVTIMGPADNMMFSSFLVANSRVTQPRYIKVSKMNVRLKCELPLFLIVWRNLPVAKTTVVSQGGDQALFLTSERYPLAMNKVTDEFVKNDQKPVSFPSNSIYDHVRVRFN